VGGVGLFRDKKRETRNKIQDTRNEKQETRYKIQNTKYKMWEMEIVVDLGGSGGKCCCGSGEVGGGVSLAESGTMVVYFLFGVEK